MTEFSFDNKTFIIISLIIIICIFLFIYKKSGKSILGLFNGDLVLNTTENRTNPVPKNSLLDTTNIIKNKSGQTSASLRTMCSKSDDPMKKPCKSYWGQDVAVIFSQPNDTSVCNIVKDDKGNNKLLVCDKNKFKTPTGRSNPMIVKSLWGSNGELIITKSTKLDLQQLDWFDRESSTNDKITLECGSHDNIRSWKKLSHFRGKDLKESYYMCGRENLFDNGKTDYADPKFLPEEQKYNSAPPITFNTKSEKETLKSQLNPGAFKSVPWTQSQMKTDSNVAVSFTGIQYNLNSKQGKDNYSNNAGVALKLTDPGYFGIKSSPGVKNITGIDPANFAKATNEKKMNSVIKSKLINPSNFDKIEPYKTPSGVPNLNKSKTQTFKDGAKDYSISSDPAAYIKNIPGYINETDKYAKKN